MAQADLLHGKDLLLGKDRISLQQFVLFSKKEVFSMKEVSSGQIYLLRTQFRPISPLPSYFRLIFLVIISMYDPTSNADLLIVLK